MKRESFLRSLGITLAFSFLGVTETRAENHVFQKGDLVRFTREFNGEKFVPEKSSIKRDAVWRVEEVDLKLGITLTLIAGHTFYSWEGQKDPGICDRFFSTNRFLEKYPETRSDRTAQIVGEIEALRPEELETYRKVSEKIPFTLWY